MSKVPRPTRPALSRTYILDQALEVLDREGIEAFTMRRLGAALGADPMAVYHYFPDKGALFDGVVETVYREVRLGATSSLAPHDQVAEAVRALRRAFLSHPRTLPLLATRPANTPELAVLTEEFLGLLEAAGVPASRALDTVTCLTVFTIGHALAQAGEPVGGGAPTPVPLGEELPRMGTAWQAMGSYDPDRQFELGLQALLTGLIGPANSPNTPTIPEPPAADRPSSNVP